MGFVDFVFTHYVNILIVPCDFVIIEHKQTIIVYSSTVTPLPNHVSRHRDLREIPSIWAYSRCRSWYEWIRIVIVLNHTTAVQMIDTDLAARIEDFDGVTYTIGSGESIRFNVANISIIRPAFVIKCVCNIGLSN